MSSYLEKLAKLGVQHALSAEASAQHGRRKYTFEIWTNDPDRTRYAGNAKDAQSGMGGARQAICLAFAQMLVRGKHDAQAYETRTRIKHTDAPKVVDALRRQLWKMSMDEMFTLLDEMDITYGCGGLSKSAHTLDGFHACISVQEGGKTNTHKS